jgi:hypothetical protein
VARSKRRSSSAETSMSESPSMGAAEAGVRSEVAGRRWGNPRSPAAWGGVGGSGRRRGELERRWRLRAKGSAAGYKKCSGEGVAARCQ